MGYEPITLQICDLELNVRKVKTDKIPLRVFGSLNQASCFGLAVVRLLHILDFSFGNDRNNEEINFVDEDNFLFENIM